MALPYKWGHQLRVVRAFRSILEDLEDKRSTQSIHCLRSSRSHPAMMAANRQSSEAVYIDDDGPASDSRKPASTKQNLNASHNNMMMLV